jgi:hypothetical protein
MPANLSTPDPMIRLVQAFARTCVVAAQAEKEKAAVVLAHRDGEAPERLPARGDPNALRVYSTGS